MQLAVFDLDGTLTRRDTLLPYAAGFHATTPWRLLSTLGILPTLARYAIGRADNGEVKSAFIRATLGGTSRADIDSYTARFVQDLTAHGMLAQALERLDRHRHEQARLVLMSASTDLYVPAIGSALGFHETICTGVRWMGDRLDGHLTTPNRRGAEKARCFADLLSRYPGLSTAAYGNAGSDLEHLRLADQPLLVNASPAARREAVRLGIPCARWR